MAIVMITGSRKNISEEKVQSVLMDEIKKEDIVIHGGAVGVDTFAERLCNAGKIKTKIIRPLRSDKKEYYLHRNAEMIGMCDRVIAFWDGKSRGTDFTIRYAQGRGKYVKIIIMEESE